MRKQLERPPKGDAKATSKANQDLARDCESGSGPGRLTPKLLLNKRIRQPQAIAFAEWFYSPQYAVFVQATIFPPTIRRTVPHPTSVFLTERAVLTQESVRSPLHRIVARLIARRGISWQIVARLYCARTARGFFITALGAGAGCGRSFRRRRGAAFSHESTCRRRFRRHDPRRFGQRGSDGWALRRRRGARFARSGRS